jgi:hypothetical protein
MEINIAFKTSNTIGKHLKPRNMRTDMDRNNGIYQLTCQDCPMKYVGQTGRTCKAVYRERIQATRTNKTNTKYAQHILDTQHSYGSTENTMTILHMATKGRYEYMSTLENFHIYNIIKKDIQINETYSDLNNPIYEGLTILTKTYKI